MKIHEYLPEVETIAMYASVQNIRGKTDEELRRLRTLGMEKAQYFCEDNVIRYDVSVNDGRIHNLL